MSDSAAYIEELRNRAVAEIRRFAGDDVQRPQAASLLELWQHCWQLSRVSREAVLAEFPEPGWDPKPGVDFLPEQMPAAEQVERAIEMFGAVAK